ncbi:hypothetical protein COV18_00240 [Candidatus Woesearchaeota archaeon CG10_big_fil_rev_8_21_14_0_10_37_12]|nr:MAG: hypothetical protein COV18_00240 [Candidatus Woesearchaeota archaeon CG10_big_fil_rev_8_21_14_0_10_37_12]
MILIDDHCHLTHKYYKDKLDLVIERARKAGVKAIICSGVNGPTNREVLELSNKYDIVKCSMGMHPTDICELEGGDEAEYGLSKHSGPIDFEAEMDFIRKQKEDIVAVGEIGLDYHWLKEKKEHDKQKEIFEQFLDLAKKIHKPAVVHTRKAENDCLDLLESSSVKHVVLHSFGGNKKTVKRGADLGYYFSVPAIIERLEHFKMIAQEVNINQLLSETDGPWLSPIPGEKNEPANVLYTVKNIAKVKGFEAEEVANNIWLNYQKVFG